MMFAKVLAVSLQTILLARWSTSDQLQGGPVGRELPPNHPMHISRQRRQVQNQNQNQNELNRNAPTVSDKLRNDLLENYDRGTFPWEHAWNASPVKNTLDGSGGLREGLQVEMGLNFHKIFDVDVQKSVVDLVAWIRFQWSDPRLVWDPEDYGNMTTAFFWIGDGSGSGGSTSEIWTPDIQLWNLASSLSDTFADAHAIVSSDGNVFWSRPGHLKPVCKFTGLEDFPFDTLQCTMEFGSWAHSGLYLRPVKLGEGFSLGSSDTSGEAFAEFSLVNVSVEEKIYPPYPVAPLEDWPVLLYHVSFSRAWQPYVRGYIMLQILLNLMGFACLWLPVPSGERMALAITSVLAAVASDLVVASQLPTASVVTWFSRFSVGSMIFAFLIVVQSTVVIYLYYYVGDDLMPTWVKWIVRKINANNLEIIDKSYPDKCPSNRQMDADDFHDNKEQENSLQWRMLAGYIDEGSRVLFPATFAVFLAVMFAW